MPTRVARLPLSNQELLAADAFAKKPPLKMVAFFRRLTDYCRHATPSHFERGEMVSFDSPVIVVRHKPGLLPSKLCTHLSNFLANFLKKFATKVRLEICKPQETPSSVKVLC